MLVDDLPLSEYGAFPAWHLSSIGTVKTTVEAAKNVCERREWWQSCKKELLGCRECRGYRNPREHISVSCPEKNEKEGEQTTIKKNRA